jgi:hypothetical protein
MRKDQETGSSSTGQSRFPEHNRLAQRVKTQRIIAGALNFWSPQGASSHQTCFSLQKTHHLSFFLESTVELAPSPARRI